MPRRDRRSTDPVAIAQQSGRPARPVDAALLSAMFIGLMRSTSFLDEARRFIKPNQFYPDREAHYQLLWHVLCRLRDGHPQFNSTMIGTEIVLELQNNPTAIHPYYQQFLLRKDPSGLIYTAFTTSNSEIQHDYYRGLLREFLLDRTVASPLRTIMQSVGMGNYPEDLEEFLDTVKSQKDRIVGLNTLPTELPVPHIATQFPPAAIYHPTGLSFIDEPLGGHREGDVNGLLGLMGSGKSTFGAHLAASVAKLEYDAAVAEQREPRLIAYFTYEEAAAKMYPRLWSAGFQIPRKKLETMGCPQDVLTTANNMEEYERKLAGRARPLCEAERWNLGWVVMNKVLRVFDMSGSGKFPHAGFGHIDEIAACLDTWTNENDQPPMIALIDYAGICCRRHIRAHNLDDSRLRFLLASFGDECRHKIAEKWGCVVWALHQIAPSEGQKKPTRLLDHTMASESRAFAENLAACGCLGSVDQTTGCRLLNWSKVRFEATENSTPITLKIHDKFAQLVDVGKQYTIDHVRSCFMTPQMRNQYKGEPTAPPVEQQRTRRTETNIRAEAIV